MSGTVEVISSDLQGTDFIDPDLLDKKGGLHGGLGSTLRATSEPILLCWITIRSDAAKSISPME